jgi:hypothetical protein
MAKRTALDWETLERELHAAGVSPAEIEAGARRLLAQARGHQPGAERAGTWAAALPPHDASDNS